jgi:hypothetical protein
VRFSHIDDLLTQSASWPGKSSFAADWLRIIFSPEALVSAHLNSLP